MESAGAARLLQQRRRQRCGGLRGVLDGPGGRRGRRVVGGQVGQLPAPLPRAHVPRRIGRRRLQPPPPARSPQPPPRPRTRPHPSRHTSHPIRNSHSSASHAAASDDPRQAQWPHMVPAHPRGQQWCKLREQAGRGRGCIVSPGCQAGAPSQVAGSPPAHRSSLPARRDAQLGCAPLMSAPLPGLGTSCKPMRYAQCPPSIGSCTCHTAAFTGYAEQTRAGASGRG